jgi:hypothetical protein
MDHEADLHGKNPPNWPTAGVGHVLSERVEAICQQVQVRHKLAASYTPRSSRSDDPSTRSTWTSMTTRRGLARGVR